LQRCALFFNGVGQDCTSLSSQTAARQMRLPRPT
jgi:hypothetical protein